MFDLQRSNGAARSTCQIADDDILRSLDQSLDRNEDLRTVGHTFTRIAGTAQFLPRLFMPGDHEFQLHISRIDRRPGIAQFMHRPTPHHVFRYATILGFVDEILLAELISRFDDFLPILQSHLASQIEQATHSLSPSPSLLCAGLLCLHFNHLRSHKKRTPEPRHEPGKHPLQWFES